MTLYIDKVESDVWSGFLVVNDKGCATSVIIQMI
jgi:hypothetical protein